MLLTTIFESITAPRNYRRRFVTANGMEASEPGKMTHESLYRTTLDLIGECVHVIDRNFRILVFNEELKRWCRSLGLDTEVVGHSMHENFPFLTATVLEEYQTVFDTGKTLITEENTTVAGREYITETRKIPVMEGDNVAAVITVIKDITERRNAEKALLESENRYRMLFESAGDAIFIIDTEGEKTGQIVAANRAAADMHAYTVDELLAMNITDLDTPDAALEAPDRIKQTLSGSWIKAEITHRRKDGTVFPVEISAGSVEIGNHKYILAFDRDISKRKKLEEKLHVLSLTDELTGLMNRRGFFSLAEQQLKLSNRLKRGLFILYIDLDNLKRINDTHGHKEGDLVLIKAANILRDCFREADVIARIGGDEFVVMLMGSVEYNIKDLTARLQNNLEQYNRRNNHSYELSLSVGVAYYDPKCPCSLDELLGHGDKMMYKEKNQKQKLKL